MKKKFLARTPAAFTLAALPLAILLSACGGDGGSSAPVASGGGGGTSTPMTVSGVAATGAPMPGATIRIDCASGSDTTTAANNGVFSKTLANATLPCVLTATSTDNLTVLHSVVAGTGSSTAVTSNITPLSELLVAKLAGVDPAAFVAAFNSNTVISSSSVADAQASVLQVLHAAGVDTTIVTDIVSGALTAGTGTGYDGVLDHLKATIETSGSSLKDIVTAVATTTNANGDTGTSIVSNLLATANGDCTALKSGVQRVVDITNKEIYPAVIDAPALKVTIDDIEYSLTKNSTCDYTLSDSESTRVLVAKSGMLVWSGSGGATGHLAISVPAQTLDVAAVAGTYNRISYGNLDSTIGAFGHTTFNANGHNSAATNCAGGFGTCQVDTLSKGDLVANPNGGFDYMESGASQARLFAFRNPAGRTILLALEGSDGGTFTVLSSQHTLSAPVLDNANSFWQVTLSSTGTTDLSQETNSATSYDAGSGLAVRTFASDSHTDQVTFNSPYAGVRSRLTNACSAATGGSYTCSASLQQPLLDSGIVMSVFGANPSVRQFLNVSVTKP